MRKFPYNTVGMILIELKTEKCQITRSTFYRLEERLGFPKGRRTGSQTKWRVYSDQQVERIKNSIKNQYNMNEPIVEKVSNFDRLVGFLRFA